MGNETTGRVPGDALTLDTPLTFGGRLSRFNGLSARRLARQCPGALQWCAEGRGDAVGVVCALALAIALGLHRPQEAR